MDLFIGQNLLEFAERFKTDENFKEYSANFKMGTRFYLFKMQAHKESNP